MAKEWEVDVKNYQSQCNSFNISLGSEFRKWGCILNPLWKVLIIKVMNTVFQVEATALQISPIYKVFLHSFLPTLAVPRLSFLMFWQDKDSIHPVSFRLWGSAILGVGIPCFCIYSPWKDIYTIVILLLAIFQLLNLWWKGQIGAQGRATLPPCILLTNSIHISNCERYKQNPVYLYLVESWHKILRSMWSQTRLVILKCLFLLLFS